MGADQALLHQHGADAGALRDAARHHHGDGVHPGHHLLAAGRHAQGRAGAARVLRHGHVHHVLRVRRRAAGVRAGASHLPARDGAQRVPPHLVRACQRRGRVPAAGVAVAGVRGHHVLGGGAGRRRVVVPLLRAHRAGILVGGQRLRHVPLGGGAARHAGLHGGRRHPRLLPPLLRLLHHQGSHPGLLDLVPLPVAGEVPIPGRSSERVRRGVALLLARRGDVRRHADRAHAGGHEDEGARGH